MADLKKLIPPHIQALGSYVPGKPLRTAERESGIKCIKMASNENPFGPSPKAIEAMHAIAADVSFYPENDVPELRNKLAQMHGLKPEQILLGNGSTALLDMIARVLLAPGLNAVTSQRTFVAYRVVVNASGGELLYAPMQGDTYDLDAIAAMINSSTRLVFLANPNNPTGTMFDADATERFLQRVPQDVIVALDEAYNDFAQVYAKRHGIEYSRSVEQVREGRFKNLIVLRTFSKAHGLAGLRLGYALGDAELLNYIGRVRTAFSISVAAEAAAIAALDDEAHIRRVLESNTVGVAQVSAALRDLGFHVVPASANFIYFDTGENTAPLVQRLQEEGIIIRGMGAWGTPTAARVSVGTPEQNAAFIRAMQRVAARAAV